MQTLEALLRTFAKRSNARLWIGRRPEVRQGQLLRSIAGQVGYPTARPDPFDVGGIMQLAAHVLAVAGSVSLVHGDCTPPQGRLRDAKAALKDMAFDAAFYSNSLWNPELPRSWSPMTSATFDCGLIGHDSDNAFIFWVEEED